jgi:hypothetical protein
VQKPANFTKALNAFGRHIGVADMAKDLERGDLQEQTLKRCLDTFTDKQLLSVPSLGKGALKTLREWQRG